jgi:hypothetical protein
MTVVSLKTDLSQVQILGLLAQLTPDEKLKISKILRAQATAERWINLSESLPDLPEITMEEINAEVKAVRKLRFERKLLN